jgi:SAM-dependent methyltransferase
MASYEPGEFWEGVLSSRGGLTGVGHGGYGPRYNRHLYAVKERAVRSALAKNGIDLRGKRVLDVGSGVGYFTNVARQLGRGSYTGFDITTTSGEHVRAIDPEATFETVDIAAPLPDDIKGLGRFDVVLMLDVAYHIVEPAKLEQALDNVWSFVEPGGHLLLVDTFGERELQPRVNPGAVPHVVFHSLPDYDRLLLSKPDANLLGLVPMYFLFNRPIVGDRFPWNRDRLSWHLRYRLFESRPVLRAMSALERVLAPRAPRNPSLKIAVLEKR